MVDDRLADATSAADAARTKREGPTIELEATEVSSKAVGEEPKPAAASESPKDAASSEAGTSSKPNRKPTPPWIVAPFSGVVGAAVVIGAGALLGWPNVQAPPPAAPQVSAAAMDDLTARVAALEGKINKPALQEAVPPGAFLKPVKDLRDEVTALRAEVDRLANSVNETKSAPQSAPAPAATVDLAAINERIDKLERASRMQGDAIASGKAAESKATDDIPLRRVVAAALLDVAVRHGDPFAAELTAAKSLSPNADALKPLDAFATTGVPSPPILCRELLALVPKLAPSPQESETTGSGIVDRLKAGAAKLVKVERTDGVGSDRSAVVARVTAAALRNDVAETRRELDGLSPADRAAAQGWLDKVKAREAALAASRQFAEETMVALTKQAQ